MVKEEIYHYCSVDTLKKIVESKALRFSDIMKSNDSKEIEFLWDKYQEYVETIDPKVVEKSELKYLKTLRNGILEDVMSLALCFSDKRDSLHMWNCYADAGIAIGFNYSSLQEWTGRLFQKDSEIPSIELKTVKYFNPVEIESFVKKECKLIDGDIYSVFMNAPFCKSDFFKAEGEVRAIIHIWLEYDKTILDYDTRTNGKKVVPLGIYENRYSKIVPFVDVPFPEEMITSITIGPNCRLNEKDIRQLLFVNNFKNFQEITIERSKGSYR